MDVDLVEFAPPEQVSSFNAPLATSFPVAIATTLAGPTQVNNAESVLDDNAAYTDPCEKHMDSDGDDDTGDKGGEFDESRARLDTKTELEAQEALDLFFELAMNTNDANIAQCTPVS